MVGGPGVRRAGLLAAGSLGPTKEELRALGLKLEAAVAL